ncbi:Putidaredoxin reductase [archaeon HR01]|nr:Putidaredoxin reductase [archaeon HR01]
MGSWSDEWWCIVRADYLIVGGGLAGGYAVEAIRSIDKVGAIVLVSDENHRPYDRVPLSKTYLRGVMKRERLYIRREVHYLQNNVDMLLGNRAVEINVSEKTVTLADGRKINYGKLLLATGGRVRKLAVEGGDLDGIYYLRTIEDSERIKAALASAGKAVVVGGGFIGCEVASALYERGLEVTIVEVSNDLLSRALDQETASWITSRFREMGVKVRTGISVTRFLGSYGKVSAVVTSGGEVLDTDVVVVGVGIAPNTELAEKAGLKVENGVVVNEYLETSAENVYAAGDVARFYSPIYGRYIRVEHYDVAVRHGEIAGSNMAGQRKPYSLPPYFFSIMPGLHIKVYGVTDIYDSIVTVDKDASGFAKFYLRNGIVDGVLLVNRNVDADGVRQLITSRRHAQVSELAKYIVKP